MKKTHQNDLDFEMINLDETAGWNKLEVEAAIKSKKVEKDDFVFQGEVTISEEELFGIGTSARKVEEAYWDDEDDDADYAEEYDEDDEYDEDVYDEEESDEDDEESEEKYLNEEEAYVARRDFSLANNNKSFGERVQAFFKNMSALDGIVAITGVMVLVVAIVTVSIFSGAKAAEEQVAAFAPIGQEMEYLSDAGRGALLAMADSKKMVPIEEEETEEPTYEYDEKDLDVETINVNMKLTSVQKDLKVKFVNHKTGKLIPSVQFKVSIKDAEGTTKEYVDDDMDGIIYIKSMVPGNATVTMLALSGEEHIAFNTVPQTVKIKDKIEYTKIDVSEEVKSEDEVNAAVEDTKKDTEVENELKDTVEWVASTKTEVGTTENYEEVDKSTIADPSQTAKAFIRVTQNVENIDEGTVEIDASEEDSEEGTTTEEETTTEEDTSTEEETSTEEATSTEEEETTTEKEDDNKNPAKNDTVSLLKDKSGNQMYLKDSSGNYVEAKYADYYNKKAVFYKKNVTIQYKYTGWQDIDGKTYFYDKDGNYVTGEQVIQGAIYNFASDGALITGSGTLGIDVSKWNGDIDWNAVKNSGISYVIIRCGYRGSTTGAMIEDPKFKANIKGATAAGLKVGIYFFSQAMNEVEAVEEASMTISLIKNYSISYPVFLDVEPSGGRADGIDKATRTKVIKAYCETIKNSGYTPGVYANKTWLESYINTGEINSYKIWLAQYNDKPTYGGKYDMWQYTSKGKVDGISGYTDLNLSYLGY